MKTLYDLLGALPDDDSEGLRTAFRRAAKGVHPDLNPGDPHAALKFRQIVRASEILTDEEQRAAYDHLLDLAGLERESASKQALARVVHKIASGAMVLSGGLAAAIGGYLVLVHISAASVGPPIAAAIKSVPTVVVSAQPRDASDQSKSLAGPQAGDESASISAKVRAPNVAMRLADAGNTQDLFVDRTSDPNGAAIAELERTTQIEPRFPAAYIDRNIIFYRSKKGRAFADPAKDIEHASHAVSASVRVRQRRTRLQAMSMPMPPQRMAAQDPSRGEVSPLTGVR
jgi:curved DNA-binding protein CbpA